MVQLRNHLDACDELGYTALMYAAASSKDAAEALVQHGASIMHTAPDGCNAFKLALEHGRLESAKALHSAAQQRDEGLADRLLNSCYTFPTTAILAAGKGHVGALKYLEHLGIDINRKVRVVNGHMNAMHRAAKVLPFIWQHAPRSLVHLMMT